MQWKPLSCKPPICIGKTAFVTHKIDISHKALPFGWCLLAVIVFGLVLVIRIRLLEIPLERDEGEYAYAGQLMLQGIPPYKLAYNMKFPGTYAAYAVIMSIFGQTIGAIHLGLLLVNAATIVLIFLLGRRLMNPTAGIAAAMSYAILSMSPSVLGLAAHATNFVVLPVLGGTLLLLNESDRQQFGRLFASGLLFGLAVLMKQPALFFIVFAAIYLVSKGVQRGTRLSDISLESLFFTVGVILPLGIALLLLWRAGVFDRFWFWAIDYARQYGTLVPLSEAPQIFLRSVREVVGAGWTLWMLAGIGVVVGLLDNRVRASVIFLLGLLLASALAVCPGFYFRYHYFVLVLPAISLLVGAAISEFSDLLAGRTILVRFMPLLVLCAALSAPILSDRTLLFTLSPVEACRRIYPESPFPESLRIAEYVREHTRLDDTIAVLGSEPQIYFYSQRRSATGYIYAYGLMEPQKYARQMQEEMMGEIERARPMYLVSVVVNDSWLWRPGSERLIFNWANQYTAQNYAAAGFVNITPTETDYYFGNAPSSVDSLKDYILIYKRNP
jgi:Dolichyl-phosphate-mannose-protein mannosyltransferase